MIDLAARVARALEGGDVRRSATTVGLARVWSAVSTRTVARRLTIPRPARAVAVGGATLGGSGKTPVAIACALEYAARGERVALIGHAYRARPGEPRIVRVDDAIGEVGDEALVCARALASTTAAVVVAPNRQAAIDFAAMHADVLVLDGVGQTSPRRAHMALLAVDASDPWGAGAVPPLGDLRAPKGALLDASDAVVSVADPRGSRELSPGGRVVEIVSAGVRIRGELLPWGALSGLGVGLVTALARSDRIVRFLERRGVVPRCVFAARDHTAPRLPWGAEPSGVDLWLATAKCASHLPPTLSGLPVATIDYALEVGALSWLP